MTNKREYAKGDMVPTNLAISVANHGSIKDVAKGKLNLTVLDDNDARHQIQGEILYAKDLAHTLISVRQLVLAGYSCTLGPQESYLLTLTLRKIQLAFDGEYWCLVPADLTPTALQQPDQIVPFLDSK
eukprot:1044430-Rhodomonas_salina.1